LKAYIFCELGLGILITMMYLNNKTDKVLALLILFFLPVDVIT
jgi:hypothetical protein